MALRATTIKAWYQVHKWTSLVCTAFLLMLCITGLPLIFHHEIDHLLGDAVEPPPRVNAAGTTTLDRMLAAARERRPDDVVQFVSWDPDEPLLRFIAMASAIDAPPEETRFLVLDARTAEVLDERGTQEGLMAFLLKLHVDMFTGLPGKLFLGAMGLLFVAAVVSGVALYGPFMRKLDFGTVRRRRGSRLKWLDLHNLLGIVTLAWMLVVGGTGVINTWVDLVVQLWRMDQLAAMIEPYRDAPPLARLGSLDRAIDTAEAAAPGMTPAFVAFPGSLLTSEHHYGVFMRGDTPLTSRLLKPVLVDAETGALTATRDMPWYVTALLVSQPLHFGDYGGLPLKIMWAVLDLVTIVVLASGLYLWLARRRSSVEERIAAHVEEAATSPTAGGSR